MPFRNVGRKGSNDVVSTPVPDLYIGRRPVETVFDLMGTNEDDLTYALGWGLKQSPSLTQDLVEMLRLEAVGSLRTVRLQQSERLAGRTDIELDFDEAQVIIEAKIGWALPRAGQLDQYAGRELVDERKRLLVVLSEATETYARGKGGLPLTVSEVPVVYLRWSDVIDKVKSAAAASSSLNEKQLLRELGDYLRSVVKPVDPYSAKTYCVSLGQQPRQGWRRSTKQILEEDLKYTHPYAINGWTKVPPNYIAFRWNGHVQSIHHVEACELIDDPSAFISDAPWHGVEHSFLAYTLGSKLGPADPLPMGQNYRDTRLWVALDLLLTAPTLLEAVRLTKERWPV